MSDLKINCHCFVLAGIFSSLLLFMNSVQSETRCLKTIGRVLCPTDPDRQFNIEVQLFDKDALPWETDDLMGSSLTDEEGNYAVEGCANDLGFWNDPDPYIFMMHRCPEPEHNVSVIRRYHKIYVEPKFLPDVVHLDPVRIDLPCGLC